MEKKRGIIVGTGRAGTHLHYGALRVNGAEIVAFVDVNKDSAELAATKLGVSHVYTSFAEALSTEKPDFVSICTNVETHIPLAIQALQSNVHVLVEKPLTNNLYDIAPLIEAQKKSAKSVCVVHNHKFYPGIQQGLQWLQEKKIGDVLHIHREMTFPSQQVRMMEPEHWAHKLPGGRLFEANPHNLYLLLEFLGAFKLTSIRGRKTSINFPHAKIDEFIATFETPKATATIKMSINAEDSSEGKIAPPVFLTIIGTKGTMLVTYEQSYLLGNIINGARFYTSIFQRIQKSIEARLKQIPKLTDKNGNVINIGIGSGHYYYMKKYLEFLRGETTVPPVTIEDAIFVEHLNNEMGKAIDRQFSSV